MMEHYDPKNFETKWAQRWEADQLYRTAPADERPKAYILDFFPYPSGDGLSVGHCRNYVPTDVLSRYYRMRGYNVLHPMGWDAFGLPAENAAIKLKTNPAKLIAQFSANYKRQFRLIGISFDWTREINSSSPEYYRWTQWIFLQLYSAWFDPRCNSARPISTLEAELAQLGSEKIPGAPPITPGQWHSLGTLERKDYLSQFRLAYRSASTVNWDPVEKTVLANEEVIDGRGWRSGALVEKKTLMQWFFRITAYADRLLEDLEGLDWPENIKLMQRNWIGRSEGAEVSFHTDAGDLRVFTTRPDTLWGATFMVLSPEHPFVPQLTSQEKQTEVQAYVSEARKKSDIDRTAEGREKTGVFTGAYAINPVNDERIPVWVADYVLMGYGTGAIMAVPAHDQRDFEFARKFRLPVRVVIQPPAKAGFASPLAADSLSEAWPGDGKMVNSAPFDGTPTDVSVMKVTAWLEENGKGRRRIQYKLRDWGISRQRYWGTPIPIVHTASGEVPVAAQDLPVRLPGVEQYEPTGTGESPLAAIPEFVNTELADGTPGRRETDTMGTFACSAWYFLRFADPNNDREAFDKQQVAYWLPVDMYVGGAEHAVMHLLYARFWTKVLHDLGYVPFVEPFKRLRNQGMILAPDGREKMSKSMGNVITPDEMVAEWGADPLRAYEMFISDFEMATPWNTNGLSGTHRWLRRAWDVILSPAPRPPADSKTEQLDRDLQRWTHKTIKKVSHDIEEFRFNTVISSLMEFTNALFGAQWHPVSDSVFQEATDILLLLLAPVAPFMAEELWALKGRPYSIHQQSWPVCDEALAADEVITLVLQVNGKVRGRLTMPVGLTEEEARTAALQNEAVLRHLNGQKPRQVFYVPGKLVNVVV
jgi:leucyl-tRNA synthetase